MLNLIGRVSFSLSVVFIAMAMGLVYTGINMTGEAMAINTVSMGDNFFSPQSISVPAGSAIEWRHDGALPHTTTSDAAIWDSDMMRSGATYSQVFDAPGTYSYVCSFHPEMVGTVVVEASAPAPTEAPAAPAAAAPLASAGGDPAADANAAAPQVVSALPVGGGPPLADASLQGAAILGALGLLLLMVGLGSVFAGARLGAGTKA